MLTFKSKDGVEINFEDCIAYQCEILREIYYPNKDVFKKEV